MEFDRDLRARQEVRLLAQQAQQAFGGLQKLDQSGLDRITEALSRAGALHAAGAGAGGLRRNGLRQ